ncbi:hypothetical protein [Microbacterium sp. H83]|uniref:hypothetical protein n=1 Tax=Microbacterium sp. H83 TaxID=1827324 RepID=UPI000ADD45A6|nr:hypothetical protein [Microbacterium sp. H83]
MTAGKVYESYIDANNALDVAAPDTFAAVAKVTTPLLYAGLSAAWADRFASGVITEGDMTIESFRVKSVHPGERVEATACLDASEVTLVDRHGESLIPDNSPVYLEMDVEFVSIDGEMLLDSQHAVPLWSCPTALRTSTPGDHDKVARFHDAECSLLARRTLCEG